METDKDTISFRVETKKKSALDKVAKMMDRDRSYVLNEAIDAYLDIHKWQIEHVKEGIGQADAGQFVPNDKMNDLLRELTGTELDED